MAALVPTAYRGTVTWIGLVAPDAPGIAARPQTELALGFEGPAGDRHAGLTRPACTRVRALHPRDLPIRNARQLSIVSAEELAEIAARIGLAALDPGLLGATLVVAGIPDFTHLPPSSRLQGPDGVTLVVDMENLPCQLPAREIAATEPEAARRLKAAAKDRRGVTAWVERPGRLRPGDTLALFVPAQRPWRP